MLGWYARHLVARLQRRVTAVSQPGVTRLHLAVIDRPAACPDTAVDQKRSVGRNPASSTTDAAVRRAANFDLR